MLSHDVNKVSAKNGSFWSDSLTADSKAKVRLIGNAATAISLNSKLHNMKESLRSDGGEVIYEGITIPMDITPQSYSDDVWYMLETPLPFLPIRLFSATAGELILGIDFILADDNVSILFKEEVTDTDMVLLYGRSLNDARATPIYKLPSGIKPKAKDSSVIANYLRNTQTPKELENAVRALVGLERVREGGVLRSVIDLGGYSRAYLFDTERIDVHYSHTPLTAGVNYPEGTWVGEEILRVVDSSHGSTWYRDYCTWGNDLPMKSIVGFDVRAEDTATTVADIDGQLTIPLVGDVAEVAAFWAAVDSREDNLDVVYEDGDGVNPLDFVFNYFLHHGLLILFDGTKMKYEALASLQKWMNDNMLCGYLPIFRVNTADGWYDMDLIVDTDRYRDFELTLEGNSLIFNESMLLVYSDYVTGLAPSDYTGTASILGYPNNVQLYPGTLQYQFLPTLGPNIQS